MIPPEPEVLLQYIFLWYVRAQNLLKMTCCIYGNDIFDVFSVKINVDNQILSVKLLNNNCMIAYEVLCRFI